MHRTQIYLTDKQRNWLKREGRATKRGQSEIIRQALDRQIESAGENADWKEALFAARGIWKDRPNIHKEMRALREEADRRLDDAE